MRMSMHDDACCRVGVVDGQILCFYMLEPPEAIEPISLGTLLRVGLCESSHAP